ncbi:MAG: SpoIIE family protein phosphatase [bacterium]|nr:SpoIIE family protein phosphatase [bacterium]
MKSLTVPASVHSLKQIRDFVMAAARLAGLDERRAYRLRLGVDEIATNAVEHGCADLEGENILHITAEVDGQEVKIILEDRGRPYDHRRTPPPDDFDLPLEQRSAGGLGIYLVQRSVDEFFYERDGKWNRNTLVMKSASCSGVAAKPAQLLLVGEDLSQEGRIAESLNQAGHSTIVVESGRQAVARFGAGQIDLILLLQLTLSDMSGLDCLARLQAEYAPFHTPLLVLSTAEELPAAEACLEHGAEDVLLREPFRPALLMRKVALSLQKHRAEQQLAQNRMEYAKAQKLANDLTQVILPVGMSLSKIHNFDRLLEKILRETKSVCNADGGTLYLREGDELNFVIMLNDSLGIAIGDDDGGELLPPPLRLHDDNGAPNHRHVATSTALLGLSINIADVYNVKTYDFSGAKAFDRRYNYRSTASLTIPLKDHEGEVFGVLQLINPKDPQSQERVPFNEYMQQVAEALAALVALVLSNQLLLERQKELLRFEDELKLGRQIQSSFLPETLPDLPGWDLAVRLHPARTVSGDFYDIFRLDQQSKVCFVIADVCDKGVGAALFMVLIRTLIRAFAEYGMGGGNALKNAVEATNNYLLQNHYQTMMFATLFIGVLDPEAGGLDYVNSGHPAPLLLDSTGIKRRLTQTAPVIGAFADSRFSVRHTELQPGELLFAFTDGITEARDAERRLFTKERLWQLMDGAQLSGASAFLDFIEEHLRRHTADAAQFDDMAMIAIQRDI